VATRSQITRSRATVNGLRHLPDHDTKWLVPVAWREPQPRAGLFQPIHASHLNDWCREAIPHLALPPGWRFVLAPGHEDVWFDSELLEE
jgi:hypothetical protein